MFVRKSLKTSAAIALIMLAHQSAASSQNSGANDGRVPAVVLGPQSAYCRIVEEQIEKSCLSNFTWDESATVLIAVDKNGDIVELGSATTPDQIKAAQLLKELKKLPAPPSNTRFPYWMCVETGNSTDKISVSARNVNYGAYMMSVQKKVKQNWAPPRGMVGNVVKLSFKLFYDGHIEKLRIADGYAPEPYERAALQAARDAVPFEPLPDGSSESVKIEFSLNYNVMSGSWNGPIVESKAGLLLQATDAMARKKYSKAIKLFEKALRLEPNDDKTKKQLSGAYNGLAASELKGKPEAAMSHFKKAKEWWPENPATPGTLEDAHKMYDTASDERDKH